MFPREPGIWCGPGIRCRNWKTSGLDAKELNKIKGKIIDMFIYEKLSLFSDIHLSDKAKLF